MDRSDPDFEADIRFLSTAEGGRRDPIRSGCCQSHDLGLAGLNDATHEYTDQEWVSPGDTVHTRLWLISPEMQSRRLSVGMRFTVQEGARVIGRGKITKVLNPRLEFATETGDEIVPDSVPSIEKPLGHDDPNSDEAVLAELEQLQNKRPSWWGAIGLLLVSLFLYMGAAKLSEAWEGVLMFIPVLLLHELGHYVAMRCFGYRNLRMFFIPLFGAAVSGQHYNVAGWKKAVVALMGPAPGILLAVPIGIVGLVLAEPILVNLSLAMLTLNGFNLLPFLPLDGGWVVHAVLFVRHPLLDAAFRLAAGLILLGVMILLHQWCLVAIAALILLTVPFAWRLARVAYRLGQEGLVALSPDAETIPTEDALIILAALRAVMPPQTPAKMLAQNIASVFETLNAVPPGVVGSVGLLAFHVGIFLMALVMTVLLSVAQLQLG